MVRLTGASVIKRKLYTDATGPQKPLACVDLDARTQRLAKAERIRERSRMRCLGLALDTPLSDQIMVTSLEPRFEPARGSAMRCIRSWCVAQKTHINYAWALEGNRDCRKNGCHPPTGVGQRGTVLGNVRSDPSPEADCLLARCAIIVNMA